MKNETISKNYGNIAPNKTFLKETYIKNCTIHQHICLTGSEASVTDLSIWDKALPFDELVKWTTCRWDEYQLCTELGEIAIFDLDLAS